MPKWPPRLLSSICILQSQVNLLEAGSKLQGCPYPLETSQAQQLQRDHLEIWGHCHWCPGLWWWIPTLVPGAFRCCGRRLVRGGRSVLSSPGPGFLLHEYLLSPRWWWIYSQRLPHSECTLRSHPLCLSWNEAVRETRDKMSDGYCMTSIIE